MAFRSSTFRISTVCTGNICRSPMAEYLIRRTAEERGMDAPGTEQGRERGGVVVDSFGISDEEQGNPADPRAQALLVRQGMDPSGHRARQITAEDLQRADLVLALDLNHLRALRHLADQHSASEDPERLHRKIRLLRTFDPEVRDQPEDQLGIYDPWYGEDSDFETTYQMIRAAVPGVLDFAAEQLDQTGSPDRD